MNKAGHILVWMMITIISTGCTGEITSGSRATQTFSPPENPYKVNTVTPGPTQTETPVPTEQLLLSTPTPFKHVIQSGETLYRLALQYNVSLDRLVSANPGLDTSMISVGTEVTIPLEDNDDFGISLPTPHPVQIGDPSCIPTMDEGLWCFVSVKNDLEITLDNVSAGINIYDGENNLFKSYTAIPPLDYYFPDRDIPLSVFIPQPLPEEYLVNPILLTALPSDIKKPRTEIINQDISYNDPKTIAEISGDINIKGSLVDEDQVWIAAIAYSEGSVVGIRKWVSSDPITENNEISFELVLYSLGPTIDKVQLYSELH